MRLIVGEVVRWAGQAWQVEGVTCMNTFRLHASEAPRTFVQLQLVPIEQPATEVVQREGT